MADFYNPKIGVLDLVIIFIESIVGLVILFLMYNSYSELNDKTK